MRFKRSNCVPITTQKRNTSSETVHVAVDQHGHHTIALPDEVPAGSGEPPMRGVRPPPPWELSPENPLLPLNGASRPNSCRLLAAQSLAMQPSMYASNEATVSDWASCEANERAVAQA